MTIGEIIMVLEQYNSKSKITCYEDEDYEISEVFYDENKDEIYFKLEEKESCRSSQ